MKIRMRGILLLVVLLAGCSSKGATNPSPTSDPTNIGSKKPYIIGMIAKVYERNGLVTGIPVEHRSTPEYPFCLLRCIIFFEGIL